MRADAIGIQWDEDGCSLVVSTQEEGDKVFLLSEPEQAYNAIVSGVGPWLYEQAEARGEFASQREEALAYDLNDPKHPRHHEVFADATKEDR